MQLLPFIGTGDVVTYGSGTTLYKVTRVKQVKFLAIESGTGRRIEGRLEHAKLARNPEDFVTTSADLEPAPDLALGKAVRFKNPGVKTRGVFVVTNRSAAGWSVARLGGKDGMRYFHSLEANQLVLVNEINSVDWE